LQICETLAYGSLTGFAGFHLILEAQEYGAVLFEIVPIKVQGGDVRDVLVQKCGQLCQGLHTESVIETSVDLVVPNSVKTAS
jgi:hypothetical protein